MADQDNDNMRIWKQVCVTDVAHTRHVNVRGGFTAIDAQCQIKRATELWGPIGGWWGIRDQNIVVVDGIVIYTAILFFPPFIADTYPPDPDPTNVAVCYLPIASDHPFKPGTDAVKKVRTDALTKGLSWIG